jgi:hypothetical protein
VNVHDPKAPQREAYLTLRRDGLDHEAACRELRIAIHGHSAYRYRRWWQAESGEPPPGRTRMDLPPLTDPGLR